MTHAAKRRSRTACRPPPLNSPINKLPDILLVEILCRLPHSKVVSQCKLVSKHWCTLLSDPYSVGRFLCLQHDQQKPLQNAYAMIPQGHREKKHRTSVITMSSQPPYSVVDTITRIFSILPCFPLQSYAHIEEQLDVVGTYNDLILCSPAQKAQCDYYICNSYTKEWVLLSPTPRVIEYGLVHVGFICDPYYSIKEEGSDSSIIKLNAEYRCKVVRLLPIVNRTYKGFSVEIYSSDTGEWREYQLPKALNSPKYDISFTGYDRCTGVACNGKLYWWNPNKPGSLIQLDPFNITSTNDNIIDTCSFIADPALTTPCRNYGNYRHIGVCQGPLRMCARWFEAFDPVTIWELRENQVDGKLEWFPPCDGDIMYLQFYGYTYKCNVRENTLEIASNNPFYDTEWTYQTHKSHRESYPILVPWWPTPLIQRRFYYRKECFNITVTGKYNITVEKACPEEEEEKRLANRLEEDVYMKLPPGHPQENEVGMVCKLQKALYGLKESMLLQIHGFSRHGSHL
ncbi:hypothetical protein ACLB2K_064747 [Fragaria x ananassa]